MLEDSFSSDPMLAGLAVQVHACFLSLSVNASDGQLSYIFTFNEN